MSSSSFPSLGIGLRSVNSSRRVTARVRSQDIQRDGARGANVTEWMHPEVVKSMKEMEKKARAEEKERAKEAALRTVHGAGSFSSSQVGPMSGASFGSTSSSIKSDRVGRDKHKGDTPGPLPFPSQLLTSSYQLGKVATLNRKVGKIAYVGYLQSLPGCWICLSAYRNHLISRRPVFDFATVKHEKRGDLLVPIEGAAPAEVNSARLPAMGVGFENYDDYPVKPEVDSSVLARAQREASRLIANICSGDHAVFIRVDDPKPGEFIPSSHPHAHAHGTSSNASADGSKGTTLPALPSARERVLADRKQAEKDRKKRKREKAKEAKRQAAAAAVGAAIIGSEDADSSAHNSPHKETASTTNAMATTSSSSSNSISEHKESQHISPSHSHHLHPHAPSPLKKPFPPTSDRTPYSPTMASQYSEVHIESESQLPLLARKLQLTGPFAEVDAIALSTPANFANSPFTLSKYLTAYFPSTVNTNEKKARVIFRWITDHIAMSKNPLDDRLQPGQKPILDTSSEMEKQAKKAAHDAVAKVNDEAGEDNPSLLKQVESQDPITVMPEGHELKRLAKDMKIAAQVDLDYGTTADSATLPTPLSPNLTTEVPSNPSDAPPSAVSPSNGLQNKSLNAKAQAFHKMDLGFGPSSKNAIRTKRRHARGSGGGPGDASSGFFLSGGFNDDLLAGYSSEEGDEGADFDHDAVEAVMKKNLEVASKGAVQPSVDPNAPITAEGVLHQKCSTAYGFAILFQALAAIAGLECLVIRGLHKTGPESRARQPINFNNADGSITRNEMTKGTDLSPPITVYSDWNLINIDSSWYIVDSFNCAGVWDVNVDASGANSPTSPGSDISSVVSSGGATGGFFKKFSNSYFAPAPENFILNHFPLYVYKHTGVEHLVATVGGSGPAASRRYRTVIGSNVSGALQTLDRFGKADSQSSYQVGRTMKDPLHMSAMELLNQPRALQLIQPPISKPEWDQYVRISRLYIEYNLETYETEYAITYGVNAIGGGVHGCTFQIELEVPIWMECGVEMIQLADMQQAIDNAQHELAIIADSSTNKRSSADGNTLSIPFASALASTRPSSKEAGLGKTDGSAPSSLPVPEGSAAGHKRGASSGFNFSHALSAATSSLMPPSIINSETLSAAASRVGSPNDGSRAGTSLENARKPKPFEQPYDLTTCWFAQKAVGARLEIRAGVAGGGDKSATSSHHLNAAVQHASIIQRHKKTLHRTRMKIHLVFPKAANYRVIVYCKNPEVNGGSNRSSMRQNQQSSLKNPECIGQVTESMENWDPLLEYSITVNQGVADIPRRNPLPHASGAAKRKEESPSSSFDASIVPVPPPINSPASASATITPALPPRHLFVGFMQLYRPTFSVPSIRMIASQIVCVKPWNGYWEIGATFQLQYVTPKEVSEMVVLSDGRWSAFNEGVHGLIPTRYANTQAEVLNSAAVSAMSPPPPDHKALAGGSSSAAAGNGQNRMPQHEMPRSKAPTLHYQQGQERQIYTLDWNLTRVPEVFVFFKVGMTYYLLSYFLPNVKSYVKELSPQLTKSELRRKRLEESTGAPASPSHSGSSSSAPSISAPVVVPPPLESRFFLSPSGIMFDYQVHYQSFLITDSQLQFVFDSQHETEFRAKLCEGWVHGRTAHEGADQLLKESELLSDTVIIEPIAAPNPKSDSYHSSIPAHLRPKHSSAGSKPSTPGLEEHEFRALPTLLNPLHQRLRIKLGIPAPNSIQNTSSTRYFTFLLYVWSKELGKLDNNGVWDEDTAQVNSTKAARRRSTGMPLHIGGNSSEGDDGLHPSISQQQGEKQFRFAMSFQFYAGQGDQESFHPSMELSAPINNIPTSKKRPQSESQMNKGISIPLKF